MDEESSYGIRYNQQEQRDWYEEYEINVHIVRGYNLFR